MIEFFSIINGVSETFPIVESRTLFPNWIKQARLEISNTNISRCPGIISLFTSGYYVTSPWDMEIISEHDKITGYCPSEEIEKLLGKQPIQIQSADGIAKYLPKRPWSNKHILKINTPWHIKSNLKFLMIPLPYSDKFELESTMGILDPSVSSEINIQCYVNGFGNFNIKAGEPLCQIIPLTENKYNFVARDASQNDREWIVKRNYLNNSTFIFNKSIVKRAYDKFFKIKR